MANYNPSLFSFCRRSVYICIFCFFVNRRVVEGVLAPKLRVSHKDLTDLRKDIRKRQKATLKPILWGFRSQGVRLVRPRRWSDDIISAIIPFYCYGMVCKVSCTPILYVVRSGISGIYEPAPLHTVAL